jgi:hypothetical protein
MRAGVEGRNQTTTMTAADYNNDRGQAAMLPAGGTGSGLLDGQKNTE